MAKKDKEPQEEETFADDMDFAEGSEVESFDFEGWEDVKPQQNVPEGDYDLKVKTVKATESNKETRGMKRKGMMMVLEVLNPPEEIERPRPIFHTIWFPLPGDPEENVQVMKEMTKESLDAFSYVPSVKGKIIPNELIGLQSKALVGLVKPTPKNKLKAPRNEISKWLSGPGVPGVVGEASSGDMF